jgi:hypothetical protein
MFRLEPTEALSESLILRRPTGASDGPAPVVREDVGDDSRRGSQRRQLIHRGLIVYGGGFCTLECNILDVSETGAMLVPSDMALCPKVFVLKVYDGPSHQCEVVWRKVWKIGVRFL